MDDEFRHWLGLRLVRALLLERLRGLLLAVEPLCASLSSRDEPDACFALSNLEAAPALGSSCDPVALRPAGPGSHPTAAQGPCPQGFPRAAPPGPCRESLSSVPPQPGSRGTAKSLPTSPGCSDTSWRWGHELHGVPATLAPSSERQQARNPWLGGFRFLT